MSFRDTEKIRLIGQKAKLFSMQAQQPGMYKGQSRPFCLFNKCASENLEPTIRQDAIAYFNDPSRGIKWHDGHNGLPSNHLCCSQSFCVNTWFPYIDKPQILNQVLRAIGYNVDTVLPFSLDATLPNGNKPFVCFEWIGQRNYLGERCAKSGKRKRGQNCTSADFAFMFRRIDGKKQIVLGEWKYTEYYPEGRCIRFSKNGTDRLSIYRTSLSASYSQIHHPIIQTNPDALFYDPFDQLMRLQLLASEMQHAGEMGADIVTVLHVAPKANQELMPRITSPSLKHLGLPTIHDVWSSLVTPGSFQGIYTQDLLNSMQQFPPNASWANYMNTRYM